MNAQEHRYGPRVHVSGNPWLHAALARIGSPGTGYGELVGLLRSVYQVLAAEACGRELPAVEAVVPTRMAAQHGAVAHWRGRLLDPGARIVVVDLVRAGMVPSQVTFELLAAVLPFDALRLDHLGLSRTSDGDGHVTGVELSGSKIGGSVEGATLIVPDPMGATGSTLIRAVEHYLEHHGRPERVLALPMIATPEFLRRTLDALPELVVHAGRVDRGLSPPDVLAAPAGEHWARERGLDQRGYIVPGAGGLGEVLNNSWC